MSAGFELEIEARDTFGKGESRRLRRRGKVPAIIYGGGEEPRAIMLGKERLQLHMEREAFYTSILTLNLGKESQAVIVKDVQRHPAKPQVLHLDFQRILADEKITLNIPIHFLGEEESIGVREQGGEISKLRTDVEISCLPKDLPEFLELDVTNLELNQLLHLSDLVAPEGVEITALVHDQNEAIIAINPPRREEEDEVAEPEEGEELPEGEESKVSAEKDVDGDGDSADAASEETSD
ncbi:MAG: 50S ribosomal protein L25/general stress protein Ctc [Candidatus Rariloculaceae bacterium]